MVTLIIYLGGTFLFGITVGEFIERRKNKESCTNNVQPIIQAYLKQKGKMFDKALKQWRE